MNVCNMNVIQVKCITFSNDTSGSEVSWELLYEYCFLTVCIFGCNRSQIALITLAVPMYHLIKLNLFN